MNISLYLAGTALLLALLTLLIQEGRALQQRSLAYPWREVWVSIAVAAGRRVLLTLLFGGINLAALNLFYQQRWFTLSLRNEAGVLWWRVLLLFLAVEFFYYWQHRCMHQVRWWWADHSVHHSPNRLVLLVAERLGWFTPLTGVVLFFAPLCLLGFSPLAVFTMVSFNLFYQFWLHTEAVGKLGWWEYVFNTPSHHRVHHAANPYYLDANYGGVLIVYDRLFGTFIEETAEEPIVFGLVQPQYSINPFAVATQEWRSILRDVRQHWSSPQRLLGYIFGVPGWSHDGSRCTSAMLKAQATALTAAASGNTYTTTAPASHQATPKHG